jgi:DNA replication protein DnaC
MEPQTTGEILRARFDELTPLLKKEKTLESFDSIQLSESETLEALRRGREEKYYELKRIEYNEKLKAERSFPHYGYEQLLDYFQMQFEVDDFNREIVERICLYFSADARFNGDLNKGLFLMGGVGVGKTSIMQFFIKNQRFSYRMEPCRDVETNFSAIGDEYLNRVSNNLTIAVNGDPFGHKEIGFCFDDLGTEANGKHYGKDKNVMADVILNRYDNKLPYFSTHITTNLSADEVKTQYGSRVTDRLREMFNVIKFPKDAKSRRK